MASYQIFHPMRATMHHVPDWNVHAKRLSYIHGVDITMEEVTIEVESDVYVQALLMRNHESDKCIIHSHGNAGMIYEDFALDKMYMFGGISSVIIYDYRGYGLSVGVPTEAGVFRDAFAVWCKARDEWGFKPNNITITGESLGASVSAWLVHKLVETSDKKQHPCALVMISGFSSMKDLISNKISPVVGHFINDEFSSTLYLKKIESHVPVLIIHGTEDMMVPYDNHEKLLEYCPHAEHHPIVGGHNTLVRDDEYIRKIKAYVIGNKN